MPVSTIFHYFKKALMFLVKGRYPLSVLLIVAFAGCGKKDEHAKVEGEPKTTERSPVAEGAKEKKKAGDITMDDLRAAAKAAGGDLDKPTPPPKSPASLANVKPDFSFTSEEWHKQYEGSFTPPYSKYLDKVIELKGIVKRVSNANDGQIELNTGSDGGYPVFCLTELAPWKKVLPGQTVVIRARISGFILRWEILGVQGPLPDKFDAAKLAGEVAADKESTNKKHNEKYIIVNGMVDRVELAKEGYADVTLKSPGSNVVVGCFFPSGQKYEIDRNKDIKKGMIISVLGKYDDGKLLDCEILERTPAK